MSYLASQNIPCEALQVSLDDAFATCTAPLDPMPTLEMILQTQKTAGISQQVSDNGKVKNIKVIYENRLLESAATNASGARTCTAVNQTYNNYTNYTLDPTQHVTANEVFTVASLATLCEPFESFLAKKINKIIDVIERKVASNTAIEAVALTGNYGTAVPLGSTVGTVNGSKELIVSTLLSAAAKTMDYTTMGTIDLALMQSGYCDNPFIVGGSAMYQYARYAKAGCCAVTGVNIRDAFTQEGTPIFYDKRVVAALGSEAKSLIIQPGSVALITYNEFNQTPFTGAGYDKFVLLAPRTGLPIDITISDNCGTVSIVGYAVTKLVGLPTDMMAIGDEYRGVTFVNKLIVTNPA